MGYGDEDGTNVGFDSYFLCRYMYSNMTGGLTAVTRAGKQERDRAASAHSDAYRDVLSPSDDGQDMYAAATRRLQLSALPPVLPCRGEQTEKVQGYIRRAVHGQGETKPLYLCGLPGTGKTATILTSVKGLRNDVRDGRLADFRFLEINCLRLHTPQHAYTNLWSFLGGETLPHKKALIKLERFFGSHKKADNRSEDGRPMLMTVCLLDEVDFMLTKNNTVIFHFLSWPLLQQSFFAVICVANIMDLQTRLSDSMTSRLGLTQLERVLFTPYTHEDIKEILTARLSGLQLDVFTTQTLTMTARKAASQAGDIRAALKICQR